MILSVQYITLSGKGILFLPPMETAASGNLLFTGAIIILLLLTALIILGIRFYHVSKTLKRTDDLLQRQDIQSETIIEFLPVGIEIYSKTGILLNINNRDCEIFGVNKKDILNGNINIQDNPNLPDTVKQAFNRKEKVEATFPYSFTIVHDTGFYGTSRTTEIKQISCKGTPVLDYNGQIQNYIFIVDDVTEQYNQEHRLEESIRLSDQAIQAADMVLWKYDIRTRLLSSYNDPINNYDRKLKQPIEEHTSFMHPDDKDTLTKIITWMDSGRDETFEFSLRVKTPQDTDWQYCTISGTPFVRDDQGHVMEYTGFRRNNTRWKELNEHLKKVNIQNELILNNTNSGLAYITTDYVVQWENISVCSASLSTNAYKKGELCYKSTYGLESPCENCVLQRALKSGLTEKRIFELNGRSLEATGTPVLGEDGRIEGVVIRLDDITEHQQMISELRIAKEQAVQSDKLKSAFLANMSHEIRTPLNAIVGFANLLQTTEDPEEKAEYNKIISTNNDLLLRLINDILNLSKIEAGFVDRKPEDFDLAQYFNELCSSVQQRMTNPDVELISDNPYPHCIVCLDKNRIAQVFMNYATNAIKYTPKGFIRIGYVYRDGGIRLYVTDSGIGIAEDKKERVYERFEKLDEFAQGTGLGLSICKAITETSGGQVGFESTEGIGSTFWSWIPCKASFPGIPEIESDTLAIKIPQEKAAITSPDTSNKRKILVAEDIESNYRLLSAILRKDYELTWTKNGAEALEAARTEHFDLILMDIKMPLMNGLQATAHIRESDRTTPIIALSAYVFDSDKEAAQQAGCNDFLVKPINKETLLRTLHKWL